MKNVIAALLIVLPTIGKAQMSSLESWTDAYIAGLAPTKHFRGNVLVGRDGRVPHKKSYGLADESWNVPNQADGRFEIPSLTEQFTAVTILQLTEAGKPLAMSHSECAQATAIVPKMAEEYTRENGILHRRIYCDRSAPVRDLSGAIAHHMGLDSRSESRPPEAGGVKLAR